MSVMEQRYRAVLEVEAGCPVTEVAQRYGVSRQSVHAWVHRYHAGGLSDRSSRPHISPTQTPAAVQALTCELRRNHPRWRESLDDRLVTYETGVDLDGYVWGVNWQDLYPGATLVTDSPTARNWAAALGIDFHEVRIQANAHDLTLIFSDLQIEELPPEWQGPDHKFPIQ
ncbi:YxiG-like protein [Streptosporangium canum]|uniref:YxiG-like protein n=1 Tax=Streptosporangium canum TaxID=324952 RepID=UPI003F4C1954